MPHQNPFVATVLTRTAPFVPSISVMAPGVCAYTRWLAGSSAIPIEPASGTDATIVFVERSTIATALFASVTNIRPSAGSITLIVCEAGNVIHRSGVGNGSGGGGGTAGSTIAIKVPKRLLATSTF